MTAINQFDLAFVVDTTGSMDGLIELAQRQMIEMVDRRSTATCAAMREIQSVLEAEFGQLDFDRHVYQTWLECALPNSDDVADKLQTTPLRVASAVSRLRARGLLVAERIANGG